MTTQRLTPWHCLRHGAHRSALYREVGRCHATGQLAIRRSTHRFLGPRGLERLRNPPRPPPAVTVVVGGAGTAAAAPHSSQNRTPVHSAAPHSGQHPESSREPTRSGGPAPTSHQWVKGPERGVFTAAFRARLVWVVPNKIAAQIGHIRELVLARTH